MTRYRLITPLGVYAPGSILDTELPSGQMFSLEWQTARRLAELGVLAPLNAGEPQRPQDEPGWTGEATRVQRSHEDTADHRAKGRSGQHRMRAKEQSKR